MPVTAPSPDRDVRAFIEGAQGSFDDFSLKAFAYQFAQNVPYQAYCRALNRTPATVRDWRAVPPVPTDAFKTGLPLCTFPPELAERSFLSSGTTTEVRGTHLLRDLSLYQASILAGWAHAGLPAREHALFLAPPPDETPESSLGCMFDTLCPDQAPGRWLMDHEGAFHLSPLHEAVNRPEPVLLFSTALNLLRLAEQCPAGLRLPTGSHVFQTGGYKGLHREVSAATVYETITDTLQVPADHVINEYGMTELCSQAYAVGFGTPHHLPPWVRVRALDPHTLIELPADTPGYLALFDLANVHSVSAILTQDFGRVIDDGAFFLHGRDPGALPRGCSRGSDALAHS